MTPDMWLTGWEPFQSSNSKYTFVFKNDRERYGGGLFTISLERNHMADRTDGTTSLIRSLSFSHTRTRANRVLSPTLSRSFPLTLSLLWPCTNVWLARVGEWRTYVLLCSLSESLAGVHYLGTTRTRADQIRSVSRRQIERVRFPVNVRRPRMQIVSVSAGTIWTGNFILRPGRRARPTSEQGTPGYTIHTYRWVIMPFRLGANPSFIMSIHAQRRDTLYVKRIHDGYRVLLLLHTVIA